MPAFSTKLLLAALGLALAATALAQTAQTEGLLSLVAMPGVGLADGWRSTSYGCSDCVFRDTQRHRNGSSSSIFAAVVPWGNLQIQSDLPFTGLSVFDAWVTGSVMTNGAMYLEDTINRRQSRWLTLDTAAKGDAKVLAGPTNDGWYHIQVNFVKLSDTTGTKLGSFVPSMWNKICILDKSGTGYTLQLDTAFLYSSDSFSFSTAAAADPLAPFPCVGARCADRPAAAAAATDLIPLYSSTVDAFSVQGAQTVDATTGFIMRLKPNVTNEDLAAICAELATTNATSRFNGICITDEETARAQAVEDPNAPVAWQFQTFSVESESDLMAMRRSLHGVVEYFERDGSAIVDYVPSLTIELPVDMATIDSAVPWGLDRIDQTDLPLDGAYSPGQLDGTGVHLYVLDTGLRTSHTEFVGRVGESVSFVTGYAVQAADGSSAEPQVSAGIAEAAASIDNAGCAPEDLDCMHATIGEVATGGEDSASVQTVPYWDGHGHGTHVSGICVGTSYGVAKKATIHAVQTMDQSGAGSYSNIIAGMNWVMQHVQKNGWRGVVNMSLGGPRSTALNDAAQQLINAGIPVVTSAGNKYGADACTQSPASNPQAIAVASSDQRDALSTFSNKGSCVDIVAPGSSILSAGIASDSAAVVMSGTSMASPHTAGVVALVLQAYPKATVADVARILTSAAKNQVFEISTAPYLLQAQQSRLAPNWKPAGAITPSPSPSPSPSPAPVTTSPAPAGTFFVGAQKLTPGWS